MKYCLLGHTNSIIYLLKFTNVYLRWSCRTSSSEYRKWVVMFIKDIISGLLTIPYTVFTHTHTHIHTHSCPSNSFIISIMCTYSYFINLYTYFIPRIRSLYSTFLTHQWFINLHFINFHFINLYILYISNSFTILFWHTNDSLIFISQICNSQILAHERSLEKVYNAFNYETQHYW